MTDCGDHAQHVGQVCPILSGALAELGDRWRHDAALAAHALASIEWIKSNAWPEITLALGLGLDPEELGCVIVRASRRVDLSSDEFGLLPQSVSSIIVARAEQLQFPL